MKKTIVITGATGAVGGAAARRFNSSGEWDVILVGRDRRKLEAFRSSLQTPGTVSIVEADLSDPASVRRAVSEIRNSNKSLHAVLNVAAVYKHSLERTARGHETMFAANHLGPFTLTTGLADLLKASGEGRVLTVSAPTSTKLDFENLNGEKKFSALGAFGGSKMCNLLFTFRLAKDFGASGVSATAYHPGLIRSGLLKEAPALLRGFFRIVSSSPEKTADSIFKILSMPPSSINGRFFTKGPKEMKAAAYAHDPTAQEKLWQKSVELAS